MLIQRNNNPPGGGPNSSPCKKEKTKRQGARNRSKVHLHFAVIFGKLGSSVYSVFLYLAGKE